MKRKNRNVKSADDNRQIIIKDSDLDSIGDKGTAVFFKYQPPKGVVPDGDKNGLIALAQDSTDYESLNSNRLSDDYSGFKGYPYLSALSQKPEYRNVTDVITDECLRNWVEIKSKSTTSNHTEKISKIVSLIDEYHVKEKIEIAITHECNFGIGRIYIDVGADDKENEKPMAIDDKKITKGKLKGFINIEPIWMYPFLYNSTNPMKKTFYKPEQWFCMGKIVHSSRLIDLVSRPVPDVLKASYNFGGISLLQLMEEYVDNWVKIRNSVADIVNYYSTSGIKTDMNKNMQTGSCSLGKSLKNRAEMFTRMRRNRGLLMIDKESEDFFQFNAPLSELDNLQTSSLKQICIPSRIPALKFTGNPIGGLNGTNEGEVKTLHETVSGIQESMIRPALKKMIDIIQLSEFGSIDNDIYFEFNPLEEMTEVEKSDVGLKNSQQLLNYVNAGAISSGEVRDAAVKDSFSLVKGVEIENDGEEEDDEENLETD